MAEHNCPKCSLRAKYDKKPRSLAGRFWRWHVRWCPGWKAYMKSLSEEEREKIRAQYGMKA
ncbi:MAG: hypothetical protein AB1500_11735 [Bacillota bacterium]